MYTPRCASVLAQANVEGREWIQADSSRVVVRTWNGHVERTSVVAGGKLYNCRAVDAQRRCRLLRQVPNGGKDNLNHFHHEQRSPSNYASSWAPSF